ncbi:MAG: 50S ribosomal protein L17 [Deltaproteobacteria bacterium]|nr:MAG: 50S ribosomal protein L17 [Deltaproteobacteria bacterium]
MRHRKAGVKLGRTSSHRIAMFRNMVTSLLEHETIETTDAKAKELRRWADKMITLAKDGSLHARRQALAVIRKKSVVAKLFSELGPRYENRNGGYTRVVKTRWRKGDGAQMSIVALLGEDEEPPKKSKKSKKPRRAEKHRETPPVGAKSDVEAKGAEGEGTAEPAPTATESHPPVDATEATASSAPASPAEPVTQPESTDTDTDTDTASSDPKES